MPDFPIIDTHLHIYDPAAVHFPWMAGVPQLNRAHLVRDLLASAPHVAIEAFIFAEVDCADDQQMREVAWVHEAAKAEPRIKGIFCSLPLEKGADAVASDLAGYAAMPLARGVRRLIQGHVETPGWCLRAPFVEAVQSLSAYGLNFEITIKHPQMRDAIELVRRCPDVRFVLDHIGKPDIKAGLMEPWAADILELAKRPNVVCKISGAITEADHAVWKPEQVKPFIAHVINAFGFDRVMFGGDWPVLTLASDYATWVKLVDEIVVAATHTEKRKLYAENARALYRI
jgi:L-fuconolactonase